MFIYTLPIDAAITSFLVRPMVEGATGAAYFDALQLEEGKIANRYNWSATRIKETLVVVSYAYTSGKI